MYKKVAAVSTFDEASELEDELVDRFGDLPEAVLHLLAAFVFKLNTKARI
ncbi:TRCF domain-containing protein [Paenibacillus sp. OT2-17]